MPVAAGRNDLRILLPTSSIVGPLLRAPGDVAVRRVIHALEAHCVSR